MKYAITPAARREAEEKNIDIGQLRPTGRGGYIQLADVLRFNEESRLVRATGLAREAARQQKIDLKDVPHAGRRIMKADVLAYAAAGAADKRIPHSGMRRVIARRMAASMAEVPQYSLFGEFDVSTLRDFMRGYAEEMKALGDVKPTYSDLFIKAAALALSRYREINSTFYEDYLEIHAGIHIGLAVAMEDGLIVPNIKNADKKALKEITRERRDLVTRARAGRLMPEEYAGGTFTITNLGQYPVQYSTPIINQPESAILGIGTITEKVVPIDGGIGIRPMMGVSITCDHRHIDGAKAAEFLAELGRIFQDAKQLQN